VAGNAQIGSKEERTINADPAGFLVSRVEVTITVSELDVIG